LEVEIPTNQEQLVLGLGHDLPQGRKVVFTVNDERQPIGLAHTPAILIWIKEASSRLCLIAPILIHDIVLR
ncbi:MAG: hypothetical protein KKF24_04505, partial [Gammaproteobacteria bacterium]|nr:hypothetical protein [Gammaproteobacteria bacterium]